MNLMLAAAVMFTRGVCASPDVAKAGARCGSVVVAENPATPAGRTISLNVIVLPAIAKRTTAPVFHMEGGPGIAGTNAAGFYAGPGSAYRRTNDVVLIDQRGAGGSGALRCAALETRPPLAEMYSDADVAACRSELEKRADLSSYTTDIAADDIDVVRKALGYEKISFWALSYGTRLAQVYMKRHPERVSRGVFAGFAPLDYRAPLYHAPNAQRVVDLLFYKCQTDADCRTRYPNLREEWTTVMRTANGPFAEALRSSMITAGGQRSLPAVIHAAAAGDLEPFRKRLRKDSSLFAEGMYLSVVCPEAVSRIRESDIAPVTRHTFLGDYRVRQELAACAGWPLKQMADSFYEAPKSTAPVLVIAGEMDVVTAPEWGYEFCSQLPKCQYVLVPDLGHAPDDLESWSHGECYDAIAATFLQSGRVDAACLKQMRPPAFK